MGAVRAWTEVQGGCQFRSREGATLNWFSRTRTLQFQGPQPHRDRLQQNLNAALQEQQAPAERLPAPAADRPRVFVVYGHDDTAREQLELILHRLGLDPFVLGLTGGGGMTIIEALEREIVDRTTRCRSGIVLLTPDDMGYSQREGEVARKPRARQNVVLEMGMLLVAVERPNVAILQKGYVELPSDAQRIIYIPFNNHVKETVPKLADRLRAAGFNLAPEAITRASS